MSSSAYLALRFEVDEHAADAWSDALLAAGALAVDLADPYAETGAETPLYAEPGVASAAAWPVTRLTALFAPGTGAEAAADHAAREAGCAIPPYAAFEVPEQDWVRATQAQFAPIPITERLWIVPSWHAPVPNALNLVLDPGLAFGTGSHPTTRLCLRWLALHLPERAEVLDYGCGSGVLAIAARKLGAATAVGVDIDPQAIVASRANAAANAVDCRFGRPAELARETFDVVVANILANPLVLLAPALATRTRHGGRIVLSGVLEEQAAQVAAAYAPWFRIAGWQVDEGWMALAGERTTNPVAR